MTTTTFDGPGPVDAARLPVSVIWTDFGGVLTPPVNETLDQLCVNNGIRRDELLAAMALIASRYGTNDPLEPLDTPLVGEAEWLRQISAELNGALAVDSVADQWFDGRDTNHAWVDTLRTARRHGISVGMLSNMVPTWDRHWRTMVDADELFDHVILSFEVGHRKPDPSMFALAAARAGVPPSRCLLVDDLEKNCAGAEAAGWRAIHFVDAASATDQLWSVFNQPQST